MTQRKNETSEIGILLRRLEILEAERAILRLLHQYGQSLDAGDEESFVDCFTENGSFVASGTRPEHTTLTLTGRDELQAFAHSHTRRPVLFHQHCVIDPLIVFENSQATCRSNLIVIMEHDDCPVIRVFGRYLDKIVPQDDGKWRFAERIAVIDSMRAGLPQLAWGMPNGTG